MEIYPIIFCLFLGLNTFGSSNAAVFCSTPLLTVNNASLINEPLDKRTYSHGDTVQYVCADGFQSVGDTIAQCDEETWTYPECIKIDECLKPTQNLEYMKLSNEKNTYSNFEILTYSCNSPYSEIPGGSFMCQEGKWLGRFVCTSKICPPPPYLENGDYTIKNQVNNVTTEVYYTCQSYYILNKQQEYYKCLNGRWETSPKCLKPCKITPDIYEKYNIKPVPDNYTRHSDKDFRLERNPGMTVEDLFNRQSYLTAWCTDGELRIETFCPKPLAIVNNAILIDQIQDERKYSHGDTARYECVEDYESNGQTIAKCDAQTWIYPECIKKAPCTKPTMNLQFVTLLDEKMTFNNLDILRYTCNKPYDKIPNGALICIDGKWNGTFDCTSSICPPPPMIEYGDFLIEQETDEVITSVSYSCQSFFVLNKQQSYYRCLDGIWETPPKCLKPCKITPDIYMEYNIMSILVDYIRHSDREVRLYCNKRWNAGALSRRSYLRAQCTDGELKIKCKCDE